MEALSPQTRTNRPQEWNWKYKKKKTTCNKVYYKNEIKNNVKDLYFISTYICEMYLLADIK